MGNHPKGYPGELEPPPASLGRGCSMCYTWAVLCPPVLPGWFMGNVEGLMRMLWSETWL